MAEDILDIEFEHILKAILDDQHTLWEAEMTALETLFEGSDMSVEEQREFIQTLNTIVACIMDIQFQTINMRPAHNICEQKHKIGAERPDHTAKLLYSKDKKLTSTYTQATASPQTHAGVKGSR